jgi:hypothetical protein
MKQVLTVAMFVCFGAAADAGVLYQQPQNPSGASYVSSWWDPDGSNYDRYVWDAFTLSSSADVWSIQWRGTYGASGPVSNFTVAIYASIPAGTQPDVAHPPLVEYETGGNASQRDVGVFGGVTMYEHMFTLPVAFQAQAGVRYWLQIEGWQAGFPDWSLAAGQGGDGHYFLCEHNNLVGTLGVPTGCWFTTRTGDVAFTLYSTIATGVGAPNDDVLSVDVANPSRGGRLDVSFTLPNAAPAQLALFDVAGRRVISQEVGALGAGAHVVDLIRQAPIGSGIYFIRLTRGGQEVATKTTIVR